MSYSYQIERPWLFTEEGQMDFLKVRDAAHRLLGIAGAFRYMELLKESGVTGDSWHMIACVDRLVELGEIVEFNRECWGQFRVFTSSKVHDL